MAISHADLNKYLGKSISEVCTNDFTSPSQNHCAHFVSHALGIQIGMLFGDMLNRTKQTGRLHSL